ncbi:MAG: hypothetical protein ACFB16_05850 [Phormidesmis sp.]
MISTRQSRHTLAESLRNWVVRCVCMWLVAVAVWGTASVPAATADSVGVGSEKAAEIMRDRAAAELDRMADGDVSDSIENAASNLESAADKAKSKVKRDISRTKDAAANVGDDLEDSAKSALDTVKDLID